MLRIIFPNNHALRRVFIAIWVELKYADNQFLPSLSFLCGKYQFSSRVLEIARARMKRLGFLKRISHFSPSHAFTAGWAFSDRFAGALVNLSNAVRAARRPPRTVTGEQKDRDSMLYA